MTKLWEAESMKNFSCSVKWFTLSVSIFKKLYELRKVFKDVIQPKLISVKLMQVSFDRYFYKFSLLQVVIINFDWIHISRKIDRNFHLLNEIPVSQFERSSWRESSFDRWGTLKLSKLLEMKANFADDVLPNLEIREN